MWSQTAAASLRVHAPQDVLEDLAPMDNRSLSLEEPDYRDRSEQAPLPTDVPENQRERIIAALGPSPIEVDDIIRFCGATPGEVQLVLVELALAGRLERHAGNRVSLV